MRFKARRTKAQTNRIFILAGAFAVFSTLAYIVGGSGPGTALVVVSGLIVAVFALEQAKLGWYYEVGRDALVVRRTFRRYIIRGTVIARVARIGWPGVTERVHAIREGRGPQTGASRQVAIGRLIGFSSVPIPIREGPPSGLEVFVLVGLEDGREYVLSPATPESFVKEMHRLLNRARRKA